MAQPRKHDAPDRLQRRLATLQQVSRNASAVAALAGMLIIAGVMAYTVGDVVLRYTLGAPLPGSVDVMAYGLALAVAASMPWGFANGTHVSVDLLSGLFPRRGRALMHCLIQIVCAAAIGGLAWRLWLLAGARRASGDRMWMLQYETWLLWYAVAAGFGACVLVCLIAAAARAGEAIAGTAP